MSDCTDGCKYRGNPAEVTAEHYAQFPNLAAKQITLAWRCKNPQLPSAKEIEFFVNEKGVCYCGSAVAQVPLSDCRGFEK